MPVQSIDAAQASTNLDGFDAIIDARSPSEFALDHLPGAQNWPVLDDDERAVVGTEYKQISAFDARKRGAAMVARRIAEHIDRHTMDKPREWRPLVYCWRGGKRSGTLAWFLDQIGFRTTLLEGGYKAFRTQVRQSLDALPLELSWVVIAGRTGSGKTRLLQALRQQGAQVIDLEGLALHRGSVLGGLPNVDQPSQKHFEMQVWSALRGLDPKHPVFVESESRKIGARQVPEALLHRMRAQGHCVVIDMPQASRIELLLDEYAFYRADPERFASHLDALTELRGREVIEAWQTAARQGQWASVFGDLMSSHYDPLYVQSIKRNFDMARALHLPVENGSDAAMGEAAKALISRFDAEAHPRPEATLGA
jgi:tRNA 2-selenouridine synthase